MGFDRSGAALLTLMAVRMISGGLMILLGLALVAGIVLVLVEGLAAGAVLGQAWSKRRGFVSGAGYVYVLPIVQCTPLLTMTSPGAPGPMAQSSAAAAFCVKDSQSRPARLAPLSTLTTTSCPFLNGIGACWLPVSSRPSRQPMWGS